MDLIMVAIFVFLSVISLTLWFRYARLVKQLTHGNTELEQLRKDYTLRGEQLNAIRHATESSASPISSFDPRYTPLYRTVLLQHQLLEGYEALALAYSVPLSEIELVHLRTEACIRRAIDAGY